MKMNLATYGLRTGSVAGNIDLPRFKDIIPVYDLTEELQFVEDKKVNVRLIGVYTTKAEMFTKISNFGDAIQSELVQEWEFPAYDFKEDCIVRDGYQVSIYGNVCEIQIQLTVVTEQEEIN